MGALLDSFKNLVGWSTNATDTTNNFAESVDGIGDSADEVDDALKEAASAVEQANEAYNEHLSNLAGIQSAYETLTAAVEQYNSTGSFTIQTLQQLNQLTAEQVAALEFHNGVASVNVDLLKQQYEIEKQEAINKLQLAKQIAIVTLEEQYLNKEAEATGSQLETQQTINENTATTYNDIYGGVILVGKNNIQNNYVTHTLASKDDSLFHVKSIGGSHVILRSGYTDDRSITLAADIAAYYSKYRTSVNANVDMTKVKNVKNVPGTKGSFVTYNTYQTIFANPDLDKIKSQLKS
jgi:predicted ribosome quality control (RQC) complex YloA/Tae2 family protein